MYVQYRSRYDWYISPNSRSLMVGDACVTFGLTVNLLFGFGNEDAEGRTLIEPRDINTIFILEARNNFTSF